MLYGRDLRLRAIEREDIPRFLRWLNDPEVRQFLVMHEPLSRAKEERWFEELLSHTNEIILAIEILVGEEWLHIGNIGLHRIDLKNKTAVLETYDLNKQAAGLTAAVSFENILSAMKLFDWARKPGLYGRRSARTRAKRALEAMGCE